MTANYLTYMLEADPAIRVIATASGGEEALVSIGKHRPDVILMDLHMPGIDGFETARRIMCSDPIPIVICTATDFDEVHTAMDALTAGALAVMKKPSGFDDPNVEAAAIIQTLKLMSEVKVVRRWNRSEVAKSFIPGPIPCDPAGDDVAIVAIGASTGGPPVIMKILSGLSPAFPVPILIVQHISTGFAAGFADWLGSASRFPVHIARGGEIPLPGHAYVAPDDKHLRVGTRGELQTTQDAPFKRLRPSVGVLFRSVAEQFGRRAVGVLLTGMGDDGAEELKLMADRGALTIVQDEESCVVFGMPREAIKLGAARFVVPPNRIVELLAPLERCSQE